jgi:hypothetical protein
MQEHEKYPCLVVNDQNALASVHLYYPVVERTSLSRVAAIHTLLALYRHVSTRNHLLRMALVRIPAGTG